MTYSITTMAITMITPILVVVVYPTLVFITVVVYSTTAASSSTTMISGMERRETQERWRG